jgi:hypothetical protein
LSYQRHRPFFFAWFIGAWALLALVSEWVGLIMLIAAIVLGLTLALVSIFRRR